MAVGMASRAGGSVGVFAMMRNRKVLFAGGPVFVLGRHRSRLPQWMQHRLPMRLVCPQWWHGGVRSVNGSAHLQQNGSRTLLTAWHFGQLTSRVTWRFSRSALICLAEW